jgi:hypothetical protein
MLKFHTPDNIPRASKRLRCEIPASIFGEVITDLSDASSEDVVVLSKKTTIKDIDYLLQEKIKFIFDICDDQFDDKTYSLMFKYACINCELIVVPTKSMRDLVKQKIDKDAFVITDPFERTRRLPNFNPDNKLKLLFFGCRDNFIPVDWFNIISKLENFGIDFTIEAIFNNEISDINNFRHKKLNIYTWTFELQTKLMEECDIILLPFYNNFKNISVKSPNRIVESLQMGKFVVTNNGVNSYKDFQDFVFLDDYDRIYDGIFWALSNKKKVLEKIKQGQKYIDLFHSPESVSNLWKKCYQLVKEKNEKQVS